MPCPVIFGEDSSNSRSRRVIQVFATETESDDAAGEYFDGYPGPMTAKKEGFAPEQAHPPGSVRGPGDEIDPGPAWVVEMIQAVVRCQNRPHDVIVDRHGACRGHLFGIALIAVSGVTTLDLEDRWDDCLR